MDGLQPIVITAGPYSSFKAHPDWTESPQRVVTAYELCVFTEDGGVAYLNGQEYPLQMGTVLLSRPGDVRSNKLHFTCQAVHFLTDDPFLRKMLDEIPSCFRLEDPQPFYPFFDAVWEAFRKTEGKFSRVLSTGRLCELLWQLHKVSPTEPVSNRQDQVRKALRMIRAHYEDPLSVEQLAKACNMSASHFHKVFVEATGTTPNRYLILTRLTAAKTLLRDRRRSVAQVAESCGFSSQAYFCECMKKYTGMSPRQFRLLTGDPEKDREELL